VSLESKFTSRTRRLGIDLESIQGIEIGLYSQKIITVSEEQIASHVSVLSTPWLLSLFEDTAADTIRQYLPIGAITVGAEVWIRHLRPAMVGSQVTLNAQITAIKGNKINYRLDAFVDGNKIGDGTLKSAVVFSGFETPK